MKTIALVGKYNDQTKKKLYQTVPEGFQLLEVPTAEDYFRLADADYMIIRTLKLGKADLELAKRLKFIQKWGAGYDNLDIPGISELGIPAASCVGVNAEAVAEIAVLHMLAVYRNLLAVNAKLKRNEWAKDQYVGRSYTLQNKLIGIVGMGNIGSKVARIVRGFGAKVQYYDPILLTPEQEKERQVTHVSMEVLLRTSDIVTLHLPATEETVDMMGAKEFALMKKGAVFINTARGKLVDVDALAEALKSGHLLGAGLDAFKQEPPGTDFPLIEMENVVMTPHSGGNTADNELDMIERCYGNITRVDQGLPISRRDVINNHLLQNKIAVEDK